MEHKSLCFQDDLQYWLYNLGFDQVAGEKTGCTFFRKEDDTCLVIDTEICNLSDYPYVDYTTRQNELMAAHNRVFRFLFNQTSSINAIQQEILIFLDGESDPEHVRRFGGNRAELEPDPTLPEATFEDCFFEAFGDRARMGLHREFAYVDLAGTTRYIDYALFAKSAKFAIELNGESFHHPVVIGPKRINGPCTTQSFFRNTFKHCADLETRR